MNHDDSVTGGSANVAARPLFPPDYRGSGVLLHVTSLPSPYGIGDLGASSRAWIDRLRDSNQSWWQILPLGPVGSGNSPYQPTSSFALNWDLISPDDLVADGLVRADELPDQASLSLAAEVDYDAVARLKNRLLDLVCAHFADRADAELKAEFEQFRNEHASWLDDYALFTALHVRYRSGHYLDWPSDLVRRIPAALTQARGELEDEIGRVRIAQFLTHRQANRMRFYARSRGIRLIGDLPFYVSPNSSDVWANPMLFQLDDEFRPRFVGGVPPDYFSEDGQLWGNPVYDWDVIRQTGYRWCIDRIKAVLAQVDVVRLDHFRGFAASWLVPAGDATARGGHWVPSPGADFFRATEQELGSLPFIAEDLGLITPDVDLLREQFQLPGTRVLQFAFDGKRENPYLPQNYVSNTVVYTATHDNNTTRGWYDELPESTRQIVCKHLRRSTLSGQDIAHELLRTAWESPAALAIAPLQDVLSLPEADRMNVPGVAEGNWRWRVTGDGLSESSLQWLRDVTIACNRSVAKNR